MEMMSQNLGNIGLALSKFQGMVGLIPKSKTAVVPMKSGGQYKYSYADLADIWDAIRESLMKNELGVSQFFSNDGSKEYLTTILIHSSGEWMKSILELAQHEKIQELGSEITYLRRYALSSILGIAADEDEDGQMANSTNKKAKKDHVPVVKQEHIVEQSITISKDQLSEIKEKMKKIKNQQYLDDLESYCLEFYKVSSFEEVNQKQFSEIMKSLNKQIQMVEVA